MDTPLIGARRWVMSRSALTAWMLAAAASALPLGCDGDDDSIPGAGGTGGTGAKAGNGGSSAKGGSAGKGAGTGGTTDGGTSADGGSGGKAGKGGRGGKGGTGGTANGGTGDVGGAGDGATGGEGAATGDSGAGGSSGAPGGAGGEAGSAGAPACQSSVVFTPEERTKIATLGPLGEVPADPTNEFANDDAAATLGQKFFFDKAFSGPLTIDNDLGAMNQTGKVSCASCHGTTSPTMADNRSSPASTSIGAGFHNRNAPGMVNSSFYEWTNWGGRFSRQWELPLPVAENAAILNSTRLQIAHVIYDDYKTEYDAVFTEYPLDASIASLPATGKPKANAGDPNGNWENLTDPERALVMRVFVNYGKALAAYTRKLVSKSSPFDAFVAGDDCAISDAAKEGLKLYVGSAGCINCHSGSLLSDGAFHNLGVPQTGPAPTFDHILATDDGRYKGISDLKAAAVSGAHTTWSDDPTAGAAKIDALSATDAANHAAFRTPTLRGVATSGPYMHSGQLATLDEVIDFYDAGGAAAQAGSTKDATIVPLGLTTEQKANLKAFLGTLNGQPVAPALLEDTSN